MLNNDHFVDFDADFVNQLLGAPEPREKLVWGDEDDYDMEDDYDGQPSEYEEWQDLNGGDDWDHGQYDEY